QKRRSNPWARIAGQTARELVYLAPVLNSTPRWRAFSAPKQLVIVPRLSASHGATAIPSAASFSVDFESAISDSDRVFKLDETTTGMLKGGPDRSPHSRRQGTIRVVGVIWHRPGAGQPWRLVTHQPHAVGKKVQVVVVL